MPIETVNFKESVYPRFQSEGNAAQFAVPYAQRVCKGVGYDIGCCKKEWAFPNAIPIDLDLDDEWDAFNLPDQKVDYIFSSHCLEHIAFLYLPDYSQEYWRPWNNKKHINMFSSQIIKDYMTDKGYKNTFVSGIDLNNAFMTMGEK